MNAVFPFTVRAYDNGYYIQQPKCRKSFLDQRPKDLTWYAFDVEVKDKDRNCSFVVYDIKDTCYGGIGPKIFEFEGVLSESDYCDLLNQRILEMAKSMETEEYNARRRNRIKEIAAELMKEIV